MDILVQRRPILKARLADNREAMFNLRVSTAKKDLESQVETAGSYCNNHVKVHKFYWDVAGGMRFDCKQFEDMLGKVHDHKISAIYNVSRKILPYII